MIKDVSITVTVKNLLATAKRGTYSDSELSEIVDMLKLHPKHSRLGRILAYSLSDFAFASLRWLGTPETNEIYYRETKSSVKPE